MDYIIENATLVDGTAALLILAPIFHPIAVNMGIAPLHFAIIMVVTFLPAISMSVPKLFGLV